MSEPGYEIDYENQCPKCGNLSLHYRNCIEFNCEDGYVEEFTDDMEIEGTGYLRKCDECKGTDVETWCPGCGANLSGEIKNKEEDYFEE